MSHTCSSEECGCVCVLAPHPMSCYYLSLLIPPAHLLSNRLQQGNSIPKSMSTSMCVLCLVPGSRVWLSLTAPASSLYAHTSASQQLHTHNFICNGQAGSSPVQSPMFPLSLPDLSGPSPCCPWLEFVKWSDSCLGTAWSTGHRKTLVQTCYFFLTSIAKPH